MGELNKEKLKEYLDEIVAKGVPSVDLIVYKDHKEVFRYLTGTVDKEHKTAVSKEQLYLMFSMTKVQTMTAVLKLIEEGKLSLEDEVGKYLPAYKNLSVETGGKIEPLKDPLKLWHLVSMQSGLDYDLSRPGIVRVLKEKGMKASTREIVDSFTESPLKFVPGTHFLYSLSHDVAAAIVEVVSGMRFSEYLDKTIWKPLDFEHTFFAKPDNSGLEGLAQQYICDDNGRIVLMEQTCNYQLSDNYESGGAGLISCTEDYAKLADTLACGGISKEGVRILKPETVELIKNNLLCEASLNDIATSMGRAGYGYGIGMQVLLHPEKIGSTSPKGVFGWDGAAGSCVTLDSASKTSLVYVQHVRNHGESYAMIHPTLRDMVFGK